MPKSNVVTRAQVADLVNLCGILARKHFHPGHAILDVEGLRSMGNEIIAKIVREVEDGGGSTDTPWLRQALRLRFRQSLTDARRMHCQTQKRGVHEVQQSVLEARPDGWQPARSVFARETNYHAIAEAVVDAERAFERIRLRLSDLEYHVFLMFFLDGLDAQTISYHLDISSSTIQSCIERLRGTLGHAK